MADCVYGVGLGAQRVPSELPIQAEESEVTDVLDVHTASLKLWPDGGEEPPKREFPTAKAQHAH
jgi:hypothetical protein